MLEMILKVMQKSGTEMHVNDVVHAQLQTPAFLTADPDVLKQKVNAALASQAKSAKSPIVKVKHKNSKVEKRGVYRLKRTIAKPPVPPSPRVDSLSTQHVGQAGEFAVMSELLFWGFNVAKLAVDEGIDIIAMRGSEHFRLQVKTTREPTAEGTFAFVLDAENLYRDATAKTF